MSRHSIEIKTLLENKRLNNSRFNPETSFKTIPSSAAQPKGLKRSQSSSCLRKQPSCEILIIEQRYRKLQQNYRVILQETKSKATLFAKQKAQIEKYQVQSLKDKKQIQRLRSMLGFIKKEDYGVQVGQAIESRSSYDKDFSNTSAYSKADQSTDAGLRDTADNWKLDDRKRCSQKNSRVRTPYKIMSNKSETTICFRSPLRQSNIKSPISKYKFVPTLTFN